MLVGSSGLAREHDGGPNRYFGGLKFALIATGNRCTLPEMSKLTGRNENRRFHLSPDPAQIATAQIRNTTSGGNDTTFNHSRAIWTSFGW